MPSKTITVQRGPSSPSGILGLLSCYTDGALALELLTGELPYLGNQPDISSIPAGAGYQVQALYSGHFSAIVPHVLNVPGRNDIEMHWGTYFGSVADGFKSDVLGCMLLALQADMEMNTSKQKSVYYTRNAVALFLNWLGSDTATLRIIDFPGA